MRILHTADWHLGKRLGQYDRMEEHDSFLQWLLHTINEQNIDVLIVAGDVFDTGNPSNAVLKQYYDFLWQVKNSCCREMVIIGGNHDSATTLNAPRDLLRLFNVHVLGGVPDRFEEQIIPVKDHSGDTKLVVCAVPFLRDRDIRLSVAGETVQQREQRIREGIVAHYQNLLPYVSSYKEKHIPVLATGHLFAAGSQPSPDSEKDIYVGNLGQVGGDQFPVEFNYVALGHLHRPQVVNKMQHVRYAGSPIQLSFSENEDNKVVVMVDFMNGQLANIEEIPVPVSRRLIRIKGDLATVKAKLSTIESRTDELPVWVEIQVETADYIYDLEEQIRQSTLSHVEPVFIRQIRTRTYQGVSENIEVILSLNDLNPLTVFEKKCKSDYAETGYDDLMETFKEAIELMEDKNTDSV